MKKRILSLLLAAVLAASLLSLPAQAAAARFSDLDGGLAATVEPLRLLGVMDGFSDGSFRPRAQLTRAQFCKMAVHALDAEDGLGLYRAVTIYPDVKPSHWAAAYINMAAKGLNAISGFSDGKFYPDRTVTLGQAATILLRLLGYKDENIGGVWPDSYLSFAASIGLTDGVESKNGNAPLTRADAAVLFMNLLRTGRAAGEEGAAGGSVLTAGGLTCKPDMVLAASNAKGPDGKETALRFTDGSVYQLAGDLVSDGSLNGLKGTLVLEGQKARTFIPDAGGSTRFVTAAKVEELLLTARDGSTYTLTAGTKVYRDRKETTWSEARSWLNPGASLTLYLGKSGSVEYIFADGGTSDQAVVVYKQGSTSGFDALTGGASGWTIYKNGAPASASDLRPYDVAAYSSATNSIRVCDTRLTGWYESCAPSPEEPVTLTLMGHAFPVLSSARATLSEFRPGDQITLLLTEDNQVAGAVKPGSGRPSGNALGIVKSGGTVELLCGVTVSGSVDADSLGAGLNQGQLVRVFPGSEKGSIGLTRLSGGAYGSLDLGRRRLGATAIADNAAVYQYQSGGLQPVSLEELGGGTLPSSRVTYARTNWAGKVDLIILDGVSYSTTLYGRAQVTRQVQVDDSGKTVDQLRVDSPSGLLGPYELRGSVRTGDYVAIVRGLNGGYADLEVLTPLRDVPNTAWTGDSVATVNGRSYSISSTAVCRNRDSGEWVSLSAAHAYAEKCDMYADKDGVVRAIEVGG